MDNALLHASGLSPAIKKDKRLTFVLCHAHLYLAESDDDWDDKCAAEKTFDISCGDGGSGSSL